MKLTIFLRASTTILTNFKLNCDQNDKKKLHWLVTLTYTTSVVAIIASHLFYG